MNQLIFITDMHSNASFNNECRYFHWSDRTFITINGIFEGFGNSQTLLCSEMFRRCGGLLNIVHLKRVQRD